MVPPPPTARQQLPFQAFYVAQRAAVLRLLVGMLGPQDAEDAFQECFLKLLRAWPPQLDDPTRIDSWALTTAHRTAIDALRRRGRELGEDALPEQPGTSAIDEGTLGVLDAPELWDAVRALAPRQRAAVVLRLVLDHSHAQVAAVLECTEDAARRSYSDGIAVLRREVAAGQLEVDR